LFNQKQNEMYTSTKATMSGLNLNANWETTETLLPFKELEFRKGEQIIGPAKANSHVFFLVKGKALQYQHNVLFDREMVCGYFVNGDFMNLDILAGETTEPRSLIAKANSIVKAVPLPQFLELMKIRPGFSQLILQAIINEKQKAQIQFQRIELMSTRQRILHFFVEYVEKAGKMVGYERVVRNILTHQELGQLCNASRQSVTTVLNDLRYRRVVHFNRRYLLVRDVKKLREMALTAHLLSF